MLNHIVQSKLRGLNNFKTSGPIWTHIDKYKIMLILTSTKSHYAYHYLGKDGF
jgi:hypothetical protein